MTCTRYKWGPDSKLHFYRCTRTWHKCQKTGGNSLLLLNAITYYYTTASLESWMTFHSLQYSCLSITYSSPEINICWSSYAEWLTVTCLSSNGHLLLLVLFYLHLVAPCTSRWIGFTDTVHITRKMLHSSHLPSNLQANRNLSVRSSILLRKAPEETCETSWETKKEWMKTEGIKQSHSLVHHDV